MASRMGNTLCILLLLFTIANTIYAYRLTKQVDIQDQAMTNDDQISNDDDDDIVVRSVLWPKICFPIMRKKDGRQYVHDQNHPSGLLKHHFARSARKCYPFDK